MQLVRFSDRTMHEKYWTVPLGTRRVVNVRWTSYLGLSDVKYWRTQCGRRINIIYGRKAEVPSVVTIFERPKDVLIQKYLENRISTSFGHLILDMTNHNYWLNVVSKRRLNVWHWRYLNVILCIFPDQEGFYRKWNKITWLSEIKRPKLVCLRFVLFCGHKDWEG